MQSGRLRLLRRQWCASRHARTAQGPRLAAGGRRQAHDASGQKLVLSLDRAVRFLYSQLGWRQYLRHRIRPFRYWFNHVKISPDGSRFTLKLRFRPTGRRRGWNDSMGVSLTCGIDGRDLRLLAHASSHLIWMDEETLYFWQRDGLYIYADESPRGRRLRQLAPRLIDQNVHFRHLPGATDQFVFDTPYR